jgi:hypothetical protein
MALDLLEMDAIDHPYKKIKQQVILSSLLPWSRKWHFKNTNARHHRQQQQQQQQLRSGS